ncbi:Os07g0649450 [Oryza sativa Japonica Group]|uniref:Os07g0649450 protein n=1 Tax=Oryza sativa subsp. japonica TaxID=39947 RepID=A0A0P0X9V8_ORYSJ|nr:Os07g0649450 [Oryza sativa Japonica Group]
MSGGATPRRARSERRRQALGQIHAWQGSGGAVELRWRLRRAPPLVRRAGRGRAAAVCSLGPEDAARPTPDPSSRHCRGWRGPVSPRAAAALRALVTGQKWRGR